MSFLRKICNSKSTINKINIEKPGKNVKKLVKKEEDKSSNIQQTKNNNIILNCKSDIIKNIKKQPLQTRNLSKKAKKTINNKEKKIQNNENNKKSIFINNLNTKTNININKDNEDIEKIENFLKSKIQSINPSVKRSKNHLNASINDFEYFNFNKNISKNNNILDKNENNSNNNEINPKTNIPKTNNNMINNIINENEEYIKSSFNNNEKKKHILKVSTNDDIFISKEINYKEKNDINNINNKKHTNEGNNKDNIINDSNILVPLTNFTRENNCFLNVLIQALFNLNKFREYLLEIFYNKTQNEVIKELCELIHSYKDIKENNKYNNQKIEATLSVNSLRTFLNNIYGSYRKGESGDPLETLENLLDLIHQEFLLLNPTKDGDNCKCPSHNFFFLDLYEFKICNNCFEMEMREFDKNCYMYNINVPEISDRINKKKQDFNAYKFQLFKNIKEINKIYENEQKIKLPGCKCPELVYYKKIKSINCDNPYLIINITWAEEFPNMKEILKIYCLLPIVEKYSNLFDTEEKDKNKTFYIKGIILYGIYHYVYIIYLNTQKRWGIADDRTIKYIDKYYDLIDCLLRNHLMPVGLIYSQSKDDIIEENEINSSILSNEDYLKLYKFCEEVENRRELKVNSIVTSKSSINETNESYLENNLFYKSIINLVNSSSDSDYEECKKNTEINNDKSSKNSINKKSIEENEKNEENGKKEENEIKEENEKNEENDKNDDIFKGRKFIGDFNQNNLKGGLIMFNASFDDQGDEKYTDNTDKEQKENEEEIYIGVKYIRKDN